MTDKVIVRFEGDGSGVEELSWGQHEIWSVMQRKSDSLPIGGVRALPPGQTVADVAAGLRFIMGRHQSLRTRLRFGLNGQPQQVVHDRGEIALEVVDAGDGDPGEAAAAVAARYMTTEFDYEHEWPLRMAVITHRGAATHVAEIYLPSGPGRVRPGRAPRRPRPPRPDRTGPPVTAVQPLEQARRQRGPAARRAHDASMRYFERLAASAPDRQFSELGRSEKPRFWQVTYESPAGYQAAMVLAARLGLSTSPVLLAAYRSGPQRSHRPRVQPVVVVQLVVNNRFRPGFGGSVSTVAQSALA